MTQDSLERLAAALSAEHDGAHAAPDLTRARIMQRLARERRKKRLKLVLFAPLLGIGLGSSAFAASGAEWPEALAWVPTLFAPAEKGDVTAAMPKGTISRVGAEVEVGLVQRDAPGDPAVAEVPQRETGARVFAESPTSPGLPPSRAPSLPHVSVAAPKLFGNQEDSGSSSPPPLEAEVPPPPPIADADIGLSLYRRAHDAQFKTSDWSAALDGYRAYLAEYPAGPLAIEASYNAALCELRLGRREAARRSLTPFARGTYGSYRQEEARALLEALGSP